MQQARRRREPGGRRGGERGAPGRSRPEPPPARSPRPRLRDPGSGGNRCERPPQGLCRQRWVRPLQVPPR